MNAVLKKPHLRGTSITVSESAFEHALFSELGRTNPYEGGEDYIRQAHLAYGVLPLSIRRTILDFCLDSNRSGALLFSGLPVDDLPLTPVNPLQRPRRSTYLAEATLLTLAAGFGEVVGYGPEKGGQILQNLVPVKRNEDKLSSESSRILLDFHTEIAFHPHLPDYLFLYCLRPDPNGQAETFVAGIDEILELLPTSIISLLRQPIFRAGIDYSFGNSDLSLSEGPIGPVLYGNPDLPYFNYDLDLMTSPVPEARVALQKVSEAANSVKKSVHLGSGDLLVIDNRRSIHGRTQFEARYDGTDRWVLRCSAITSLRSSAADRTLNSRVINTSF